VVPTGPSLVSSPIRTDVRNPTVVFEYDRCPEGERNRILDRNSLARVPLKV
jgi:hypothetical protein